jgi:hypothetical protein
MAGLVRENFEARIEGMAALNAAKGRDAATLRGGNESHQTNPS